MVNVRPKGKKIVGARTRPSAQTGVQPRPGVLQSPPPPLTEPHSASARRGVEARPSGAPRIVPAPIFQMNGTVRKDPGPPALSVSSRVTVWNWQIGTSPSTTWGGAYIWGLKMVRLGVLALLRLRSRLSMGRKGARRHWCRADAEEAREGWRAYKPDRGVFTRLQPEEDGAGHDEARPPPTPPACAAAGPRTGLGDSVDGAAY